MWVLPKYPVQFIELLLNSPMKIVGKNFIFTIISTLIIVASLLLAGEIAVRLCQILSGNGRYIWLPDEYLGRRHTSNNKFLYTEKFSKEFLVKRKTNSLGFIGNQISIKKPTDIIRIIIIGDSFTEGMQVREGKNFCEQLQCLLNDGKLVAGKNFEVINAGASGSSPITEYILLKRELAILKPDIVMLGVFTNDVFEDNKIQAMSLLDKDGFPVKINKFFTNKIIDNRRPASEPTKLQESIYKFKRFIVDRSVLFQGICRSIKNRNKNSSLNKKMNALPQFQDKNQFFIIQDDNPLFKDKDFRDKAWGQTRKYILGIRDLAECIGAKFGMFYIPVEAQLSLKHYGENIKGYFERPPNLYLNDKLAELSREKSILFLDLLPLLEVNKDEELYYSKDGHFKEAGHRLAAQGLSSLVKDVLKIP